MKPYLFLLTLFSLQSLPAAEAWLLEMETRFHEALIKRFTTGDPVACAQVTDKLPDLVKAGKIRELESISTTSENGGKIHPTAKFIRKLKSGEESSIDVGTTYTGGSGAADERSFLIASKGEGLGAKLAIKVTGRLGKAWQPTFSIAMGESVRVLLERDPDAKESFWKPEGLLTLRAPVPEDCVFTWVIGNGHPVLEVGQEAAGGIPSLAGFQETVTLPAKSEDDWRDFGTVVKWTIEAAIGPVYDLQVAAEENGASTAARAYSSKGHLGKSLDSVKSPISTFVEVIDKNGEHTESGRKDQGTAEARPIRLH